MKKDRLIFWISTGLFVAFTLLTAITQLVPAQSAIEVMNVLTFPQYMLPFLGLAKVAGIIAIVSPVPLRIKEWAYAGILFDNVGAAYAMIAVGGRFDQWGFMILPISICVLSYMYMHKILQIKTASD